MKVNPGVAAIHVLFKTHLDVGFTDLAARVVDTYLHAFLPQAIALSRSLREKESDARFVWTTGSWLIHQALESTSGRKRRSLETAILDGDVVWHGLPFTTHTELMDAAHFRAGLGISTELDRRFGRRTIAAKMTDVPGHTRAMVPLLAEAGIRFLHIGVNPASTPPAVPPLFRWVHDDGSEITVLYDKGSYGGLSLPGDHTEAVYFAHTGDNCGPPAIGEVEATFRKLQASFPDATVRASSLNTFARSLAPLSGSLPVVTGEIGDTWIHGVATDPAKVSLYRALRRWRNALRSGPAARLREFDRRMLLLPEHTWGRDGKTCLGIGDTYDREFRQSAFRKKRLSAPYRKMEESWREQRGYLDHALSALEGTSCLPGAVAVTDALRPARARVQGKFLAPGEIIRTRHFDVALDARSGAMCHLLDRETGRQWAGPENLLGTTWFQVFSGADYDWLWRRYNRKHARNRLWAEPDFLKPGVENAVARSQSWTAQARTTCLVETAAETRVIVTAACPDEPCDLYGCPRVFQTEMVFPSRAKEVRFTVQWFDRPPSRVPGATWFSLRSDVLPGGCWHLLKMGSWIDPRDVVRDGNRSLHAVEGCRYRDANSALFLHNPDAPLVAPGRPSLVRFSNRLPRADDGMHFNLHNNTWGTNFPLWYGDDARFDFVMTFDDPNPQTHD